MADYTISKLLGYETCPDCDERIDSEGPIVGCCDHAPLDVLLEIYEKEMSEHAHKAMCRLMDAALKNKKVPQPCDGVDCKVSGDIVEHLILTNTAFHGLRFYLCPICKATDEARGYVFRKAKGARWKVWSHSTE